MKVHRFLPGVLAAAVVLSLSACGGVPRKGEDPSSAAGTQAPPSAYQVLREAFEATNTLKSGSLDFDVSMNVSSLGMTMDMGAKGQVLIEGDRILVTVTAALMGQEIPLTIYNDGSYSYTEYAGMKTKTPADVSSVTDQLAGFELKEDYFRNLKMTEADGVRTLTLKVEGGKLEKILKELMASDLFGAAPGLDTGDAADLEIGDLEIVARVGAGQYLQDLTVSISIVAKGEAPSLTDPESTVTSESKLELKLSAVLNSPGTPVTVTPPADLDSYVEVTEGIDPYGLPEEAIEAVETRMFDEDLHPVSDYAEVYQELCEEYGEDTINAILSLYFMSQET